MRPHPRRVTVPRAVHAQLFEATERLGREIERLSDMDPTTKAGGIFNSFDFHLSPSGPKLIEINTNAGGAFVLADQSLHGSFAGGACNGLGKVDLIAPEKTIMDCWRAIRPNQTLLRVAIIDENPALQPLLQDMKIAAQRLRKLGIEADVVDVQELAIESGRLVARGKPVDMVYNRLTDFHLSEPHSQVLFEAWTSGMALVAPNPAAYSAYADKLRLTQLWNSASHRMSDLPEVLRSEFMSPSSAERMWKNRRHLVFKPRHGYGSKGVLRGDKVTRGRFEDALKEQMIAQEYAEPSRLTIETAGESVSMKLDFRVWTHGSLPLFVGARAYRGQVTSMRGPEEGFASIVWEDRQDASRGGCKK